MTENIHQGDGHIDNPSVRHERTDANFRSIMLIILATLVSAAVIHYAVLLFLHGYAGHQANIKKSSFPLAPGPTTSLPQGPRLEQLDRLAGNEAPDVYQREESKLAILDSYGPTKEEGFVHVPIEEAMRALEAKLPVRAGPSPEQKRRSGGLIDAGEPNSGRLFRGRPR